MCRRSRSAPLCSLCHAALCYPPPRSPAGASLVELYTAFAYEGPRLVPRVKRELAALLRRDGYASVAEAVGADHPPREQLEREQRRQQKGGWGWGWRRG